MSSPVSWMSDEQYAAARLPERLVAWADSQVGVKEQPLGSNRGLQVERYLSATGLPGGHPWCAAFVYWCAIQAGLRDLPVDRNAARVALWHSWAWKRGRNRTGPERGRLFYWLNKTGTGHIGICLGKPVLGVFRTIEGNTDGESGSREGHAVVKRTRTILGLKRRYRYGFIDLEVDR